ncbi:BTAD domain-containing putative transcriptional regulator [Streptomyces sp. DSM 44917]|uniref:BTAD domain-containing putative transcriptional regulator n=1 Tax=Streptomyces boetiae TaxID=3075541 RepID=A0ABU2L1B1_9ACTN|nr:BTAD domain-containing putative transcriptional regulator [Streptomyces sp. DSM 44917]MDT0305356.1 BTAD domain-containing putative transcriptional regulator [Streptomyces sp. DSM 44917]
MEAVGTEHGERVGLGESVADFRLLGPVGLWRGSALLGPTTAQQRTVLAMLLLEPGRVVPMDRLVTALWGNEPPGSARNAVQGIVSRLRRLLAGLGAGEGPAGPPAELATASPGYCLWVGRDRVDLHRFRELVRRAKAEEPERGHRLLGEALALWRGPALTEVSGSWLAEAVAPGLEEERLSAQEERAALDLRLDRPHEAVAGLSALVAAHPLRERPATLLLTALHRSGRRADALELFRRVRRRFVDELGIEPGEALRGAHQDVLAGDAGPGGARERTAPRAATVPAQRPAEVPPQRRAFARVAPAPLAVPKQLPPDIEHFASRDAELAMLSTLAEQGLRRNAPGSPVICVVAGTGGVGKTAFAVHWAHRERARFPDGQLYVNLRGFGPTGTALSTADVVRAFLDALQVAPDRIPDAPEAQVGLYRSLLADRRMLIVLDNARDADQVRPLLPTSPGCLVLITSRNELTGLVVAEGAHRLPLDLLSAAGSRELLLRRLGAGLAGMRGEAGAACAAAFAEMSRPEPAPGAVPPPGAETSGAGRQPGAGTAGTTAVNRIVDDIVAMCAGLPLALAIVAARAATHPAFTLASLTAREPEAAGEELDLFDSGDPSTDVRTVFSWSYRALTGPAARLFRLLGLRETPELTVAAAASLAGVPAGQARRLLAELVRAHLVGERAPGRFSCHDLLWAYARELTEELDTEEDRREALHRLLDHYVHSAVAGDRLLNPHVGIPVEPGAACPGVTVTGHADAAAARAWFAAELPALLAAIAQAERAGFDAHATQLPHAARAFLYQSGHTRHQLATHEVALAASRRREAPADQALSHLYLGQACGKQGDFGAWHAHGQRALELFERLEDRLGQAVAHLHLDIAMGSQRRFEDSLHHSARALALFRTIGNRVGEAQALNNVGWNHARLGAFEEARRYCEMALAIHREYAYVMGESATLDSLGYIHHRLGRPAEAIAYYEQALVWRAGKERVTEAATRTRLAEAQRDAHRPEDARRTLRQALSLLEEITHPDATRVRDLLRALPAGPAEETVDEAS